MRACNSRSRAACDMEAVAAWRLMLRAAGDGGQTAKSQAVRLTSGPVSVQRRAGVCTVNGGMDTCMPAFLARYDWYIIRVPDDVHGLQIQRCFCAPQRLAAAGAPGSYSVVANVCDPGSHRSSASSKCVWTTKLR